MTGFLLFAIGTTGHAARTTRVIDTVYRADGLPASGTLLISWGNSVLSRCANNYFGIKAHGKQASVEMQTTEFGSAGGSPARPQRVSALFAAYESIGSCFACRDRLILNGAVYAEARACAQNPQAFALALAKHWATDPNYAEKLLRIYHDNNLSRLDDHAGAVGTPVL